MTRETAVAMVQRILNADYADDDEVDGWLDELDRAHGCPSGYVSDLIFWPEGRQPSAAEVVDKALSYQPFAL